MMGLGELVLVGLGLHDERGISLQGIEEARGADTVFAEFYTSLMPSLSLEGLERLLGRRVSVVSRKALEEEEGRLILERARKGKVVLLVPGDPLIATTHVDLRIRAEKEGVKTRVVHGASILSAVIGLSGLQNYKYGRSVTIPFTEGAVMSETPYMVIMENRERGLHTLCFLDIRVEEDRYMTIREGLETLLATEKHKKLGVVTVDTLLIGIARAGSTHPAFKAGYIKEIMDYDFGG
ncbi:MAG: diphthine synthase, partial [Candidatus Bathyarchaeia archaeon]